MPNTRPTKPPALSRRDVFNSPGSFLTLGLALGLGAGLARRAPGTCGTLAAVPFFLLLNLLDPVWYGGALAVAMLVGIPLCARAAETLGRHDHPAIVWDEMVGLWVTLCFIPFSWAALLLGFALFRLFDIVKPWPISLIDRRLGGGSGIMLDDIIAGILAKATLRLLLPHLPTLS